MLEFLVRLLIMLRGEDKIATDNYLRFPNNIFKPEELVVDDNTYRLLRARFENLYELYDYLKADPKINSLIFRSLSSETGSYDFAGKPYAEAVEDLVGDYTPGYEEFLKIQSDLNVKKGLIHRYKVVRTVAGGHLNVPAYSAGNPLCYESEERIRKPKFACMHVNLSYRYDTTKSQVFNKAIIITNVLRALEKAGYSVDLNTFEFSMKRSSYNMDELSYVIVQIKRHGGRVNMQALYKTLCQVEFLRRILFRILETMDVRNDWARGYGSPCSEEFVRKALKLGKNDIFFNQPSDMGIWGDDLAADFERAINHLNMQDKIDVEKAKREFSEREKVISMTQKDPRR